MFKIFSVLAFLRCCRRHCCCWRPFCMKLTRRYLAFLLMLLFGMCLCLRLLSNLLLANVVAVVGVHEVLAGVGVYLLLLAYLLQLFVILSLLFAPLLVSLLLLTFPLLPASLLLLAYLMLAFLVCCLCVLKCEKHIRLSGHTLAIYDCRTANLSCYQTIEISNIRLAN